MEQDFIELNLSKEELAVIFNCLIGSYSCPPSQSDLVNKVYSLCRKHGVTKSDFYCKSL